ncbi:MAG: hypothetical protein Q8M03_10430 [Legionella sp.]|nr:hypothetical protein [Legionella sp.]
MGVNKLLTELLARMPELEWQLDKIGMAFSSKALPPGLFRQPFDAPAQAYITEIKADIATVSTTTNARVERYLALKINQKINVLVKLCSRHNRKGPVQETVNYDIHQLSTRQQRLESLDLAIQLLVEQKEALEKALQQRENVGDCIAQLSLQNELGELEKRLTLARETYARATG